MKKEIYIDVINNTPLYFDFDEVRNYLSGIYAVAVEDPDISGDDMLDITLVGDRVKESVLGEENG